MKNLDLNAIGVCEMDTNEVMNIEGGNLRWFLLPEFYDAVVDFCEGLYSGAKDGFSK